ncbi:MAG: diguanylate cyclase [Thermoleophilia bacterium]|nr:diguanylate cyclase [Thermoleophilia bacterium]
MPPSTHRAGLRQIAVLVDEPRLRAAIAAAASRAGLDVRAATPSPEERGPDAAVAQWPPTAGRGPHWGLPEDVPVVAVVPPGDVAAARAALDAGAADYAWADAEPGDVVLRLEAARPRRPEPPAVPAATPMRSMLEAMPMGAAVVRPDGTIAEVNDALCRMAGCEREALVGLRATHDTLLGGDAARISALFARATREGRAADAFVMGPAGAPVVVAHLTASLDDAGRPSGFLLGVRPRNAQERIADALARLAGASQAAGNDIAAVLAREAMALTGAPAAAVLRADARGLTVVARAGHGAPRTGERAPGADPRAAAETLMRATRPADDVASASLRVAGGLWGRVAVSVGRGDRGAVERLLDRFCQVASIAVAGHAGSAKPDLDHDPLTGLLSNRAFFGSLDREFAAARERGSALALVLVDLDGFKRVNDNHGHVEGDRVLAEVADRLRAAAGSDHVLGRLGGEEFGWLIPGGSIEDAFDTARAARRAVADGAFGLVGRVGATLGVSELGSSQAETVEELRQQAEVALHWGKISGGNRCVSYSFTLAEQVFARKAALTAEGPSLRGMRALAWAVDARDPHTQRHSIRVADLAVQIATALGWGPERVTALREAGLVHDVGKIAVPDRILFKPGRLTAEEFALVTRHPVVGAQIVADVLSAEQATWVRGHHERWDGRGYPDALAGEDIPEEARVIALADAWDVMTSVRAYKGVVDAGGAAAEIRRCSGTQFWPAAVDALLRLIDGGAVGVRGVAHPIADVVAAAKSLAA